MTILRAQGGTWDYACGSLNEGGNHMSDIENELNVSEEIRQAADDTPDVTDHIGELRALLGAMPPCLVVTPSHRRQLVRIAAVAVNAIESIDGKPRIRITHTVRPEEMQQAMLRLSLKCIEFAGEVFDGHCNRGEGSALAQAAINLADAATRQAGPAPAAPRNVVYMGEGVDRAELGPWLREQLKRLFDDATPAPGGAK